MVKKGPIEFEIASHMRKDEQIQKTEKVWYFSFSQNYLIYPAEKLVLLEDFRFVLALALIHCEIVKIEFLLKIKMFVSFMWNRVVHENYLTG